MGHAAVIDKFSHTADAVAAHLPAGAVRIPHLHLKIRDFGRIDEDHAVAADSEVPVTELFDDLRLLFRIELIFKSADIHVVIAASFHLGKTNIHTSILFFPVKYLFLQPL